MSIQDTIKYESLIYIFKSLKGLNSDFSKNLFEVNQNRTSRRQIGRDFLYINYPTVKRNFFENTIFSKGVKIWNQIQLDLRSETDFKNFEKISLLICLSYRSKKHKILLNKSHDCASK